ncbi:Kinesin motor domain, conserved site,P-loop containing nucleoside triphosphate hydrolase,Kinesin motor [Cinara cedri]|uniref:Kinesin-like protein n=1 Tax=Cinara cedri TaxID=506608 RepID=A0A5E4MKM7_9HEMI|nr:Kinesin motor domain, conserved site,P-loop containing nucleoside triphosphate hydrolase,Kinesin motor [Cinara cedri]
MKVNTSDDSLSSLNDSTGSLNRSYNDISEQENGIFVVVRSRPLSTKENKASEPSIVSFPGSGRILIDGLQSIIGGSNGPKTKLFSFNVVFEPLATQEDVFQYSGIKKLIEMAAEGFNTTCFCYGQTGSGKTHTLTGPPGMFFNRRIEPFSKDHGLVFRSFMYLFRLVQQRQDLHFVLKASFLEIYNEKVIDLLNPGTVRKPLDVRWSRKARNFYVDNLFMVDCEELDDLQAVLEEGMKNRTVGSHNMNECSSRSHTMLTVYITSEQQMSEDGVFITKQGKINFVDLAGSEMTKKTMSEGKTLAEANNINKSLMVLGYCIASLSDPKKRNGHIPYRDSKLTKLLSDSLAGTGVTLMIACVSPAKSNASETISTLRYAARAKKIKTKPVIVMDPREALIVTLRREVEALQNENDHLRKALDITKATSATISNVKMPPNMDMDRLIQMDPKELVDLVKHYANENEALRRENAELFNSRDLLQRDHEIVCRENERLLKKLEDVNSACIRSPIIPARGQYIDKTETIPTKTQYNIHTKNNTSAERDKRELPETYQREIDIKGIGRTYGISNILGSLKNREKTSSSSKKPSTKQTSTTPRMPIDRPPPSPVNGRPYGIDEGLNSAASTLASIISRQAFDIPRKSRDSLDEYDDDDDDDDGDDDDGDEGHRPSSGGGDRDSVFSGGGGRRSLPDIGTAGGGDGVRRTRRDSVGGRGVPAAAGKQGAPAQTAAAAAVHRDPFGSPVTPKVYNGFRRRAAAAAAVANAPG